MSIGGSTFEGFFIKGACFKVAPSESVTALLTFELFVRGRCRLLFDVAIVLNPVLETELVSLFWNARAAAFSLI